MCGETHLVRSGHLFRHFAEINFLLCVMPCKTYLTGCRSKLEMWRQLRCGKRGVCEAVAAAI